jgi:ribosomal 50S subunit-associated protein YjgA (DUF615 family)
MKQKKSLSRITIDIPAEDHMKFKAMAAFAGKSMRELVVESIQKHLEQLEANRTSISALKPRK